MYHDGEITLYVMNLPMNVEYHSLRDIFSSFGTVAHVFLKKDKATQKCTGSAYVTFLRESDGLKAIQQLEGANYKGNILRVREALHSSARMFHQQFSRSNCNFRSNKKNWDRKNKGSYSDPPKTENKGSEQNLEQKDDANEAEQEDEEGDGDFVLEEEPQDQNDQSQQANKTQDQSEVPTQEQIFERNGLRIYSKSPRKFRRNNSNGIRPYERGFTNDRPNRSHRNDDHHGYRGYDNSRSRNRDDYDEMYERNFPPMNYMNQPNGPPRMHHIQPIIIPIDPASGLIMNPQNGLLSGGLPMTMVPISMPRIGPHPAMMPPDMEMNDRYGAMPPPGRQYKPQNRDRRYNQGQWNNHNPKYNYPMNNDYDYSDDEGLPPMPQTVHNPSVSPINRPKINAPSEDNSPYYDMPKQSSLIESFQNQRKEQSYQKPQQADPSLPGYTPPISARNAQNAAVVPPREVIAELVDYDYSDEA